MNTSKQSTKVSQSGFSHLFIIVTLLVLGVIGGCFWALKAHSKQADNARPSTSVTAKATLRETKAATTNATTPISIPSTVEPATTSAPVLSCEVADIAKPAYGSVVNPQVMISARGGTATNLTITASVQAADLNTSKTTTYAKLVGSDTITVLSFSVPYATATSAFGQYMVTVNNGAALCSDSFPLPTPPPVATGGDTSQLACTVEGIWAKPGYGTTMQPIVHITNGNSNAVLANMSIDATLTVGKGVTSYHQTYAKFINSGSVTMPSFTVNAYSSANGATGQYSVSINGAPLCSAAFPLPYTDAPKG